MTMLYFILFMKPAVELNLTPTTASYRAWFNDVMDLNLLVMNIYDPLFTEKQL